MAVQTLFLSKRYFFQWCHMHIIWKFFLSFPPSIKGANVGMFVLRLVDHSPRKGKIVVDKDNHFYFIPSNTKNCISQC